MFMRSDQTCDIIALDSRGQRRLPVYRPVFIRLSSGKSVTARIVSISSAGVGVTFRAPGKIGAVLNLRFLLTVDLQVKEINATARIVHTHLSKDEYYSMLEFTDIDNEELYYVEKFIDEKSIFFPIAA